MQSVVTIHLYLGILAVVAALALVWRLPGRRITLYLLTVQILLGIWLVSSGLRISWVHILCAVVAWVLYMAANGVARRKPGSKLILIFTAIASLLVVFAGAIGGMVMAHNAH